MILTTKEISSLILGNLKQKYTPLEFLTIWILDKANTKRIVTELIESDEQTTDEVINNIADSINVESSDVQEFFNDLMQKVWNKIEQNRKRK